MDQREELRQRARSLRRDGLSARQIAHTLGVPFNSTLEGWLVGTEPPEWTRRAQAKDAERARARALRATGLSYPQIAAQLDVSKSSVSLWVRDLPRPPRAVPRSVQLRAIGREYWRRESRRREIERQQTKFTAATEIGAISERELLIVGAALYWAEGTKDKPYRRQERVVFTNSDRYMISIFIAWLRLLDVPPEHVRYRIAIHASADLAAAEAYWAEVAGVPPSSFQRATLKKHEVKPGRLNIGADYHGCLVIGVLQSAALYQRIEGWFRGVALAADQLQHSDRR